MFVHNYQRAGNVAQAKVILWLYYGIGSSIYAYAIFLNLMTVKADILMGLAIVLALVKAYLDVRKSNREERKARQEERLREIEILERQQALKK